MFSFDCHNMGSLWIWIHKVELEKTSSCHESFGFHVWRMRCAPLMVHGRLLNASWRSTSCPNMNRKVFLSTRWTWIGWDRCQAFSKISFTTTAMKFLVDMIFPTRDRSLGDEGDEAGVNDKRLSAQLHDSVIAISSSTDWDVSMLSVMVAVMGRSMWKIKCTDTRMKVILRERIASVGGSAWRYRGWAVR